MTFTPAIRYVQSRNTFTSSHGGIENSGNDFDFVLRQAYLEMKNVFKGAPEVTFWAGEGATAPWSKRRRAGARPYRCPYGTKTRASLC
jgi:hypothetical protein